MKTCVLFRIGRNAGALILITWALCPIQVIALPERACELSSLGPIGYELCLAQRLDDQIASLRAKAAAFEAMARQRNPKCDQEGPDPARPAGCEMAASNMSRDAGSIRLEADQKEAEAESHRTRAEAMRKKVFDSGK